MRGRKPKSLELRLLEGNPGRRPLSSAGPFIEGIPEKPEDLDEDASQEWDRLTIALAGILSPASRGTLLCACDAYSQFVAAKRVLDKEGPTYTTQGEGGLMIRQHPQVRMREAARRSYQLALSELGAAPVRHGHVRKLPTAESLKPSGLARFLS
ncbi:MAG: P27 family phage terminase small subunit [Nitrospirales bacterium]